MAKKNIRRKIHPKRLMHNLFIYSDEIKKSAIAEKINPAVFDCVNLLQERVSHRVPFQLEKDENEIADEILRYLMAIKYSDRIKLPPPIDFSRPVYRSAWITSKLRRRRSVE